MRKLIMVVMLMLGLTFIYNPQTNSGYVYVNSDADNWIILVDHSMNVLRYYRGVVGKEERADTGLEIWRQDKIDKGFPFKSIILPFRQQQQGR